MSCRVFVGFPCYSFLRGFPCFSVLFPLVILQLISGLLAQRTLRDILMPRGKNWLPTVSRQFLTRNYPRPNCLLKCLPNYLSPTIEDIFSSFKIAPVVRVIARQLSGKNCLAAIFASRHQDASPGPLGGDKKSFEERKDRGHLFPFTTPRGPPIGKFQSRSKISIFEPIFGKGTRRSTFQWKKRVFQWKGGRQFSEWEVW